MSICPNVNISSRSICPVGRFVRMSICPNVDMSECRFVRILICPTVNLSECWYVQSVDLSGRRFVRMLICLVGRFILFPFRFCSVFFPISFRFRSGFQGLLCPNHIRRFPRVTMSQPYTRLIQYITFQEFWGVVTLPHPLRSPDLGAGHKLIDHLFQFYFIRFIPIHLIRFV